MFLASVLPGFRHLRTPFAIGALIAIQAWLLAGTLVPQRSEASGTVRRIYELSDAAGRPTTIAALTFVIYIFGDVAQLSHDQMIRLFKWRFSRIHVILTYESLDQLMDLAKTTYDSIPNAPRSEEPPRGLMGKIADEFPSVRVYLIASHIDIYMEHDRLDCEANFQMNVGIYSAPLWVVLGFQLSWYWYIGIITSIILFRRGVDTRRKANAILVQSIHSGLVESRAIKDVKESFAAEEARGPGSGGPAA